MLLVCEKCFVISNENGMVFNKQLSDIELQKLQKIRGYLLFSFDELTMLRYFPYQLFAQDLGPFIRTGNLK